MPNPNPTIVIVPGAWQPAEAFEAFAEQLRGLGYPSQVVSLPSVGGTGIPLPGLEDDVRAVSDAVTKHANEARDVVLLCHSYGGMVGSCAVRTFVDLCCANPIAWKLMQNCRAGRIRIDRAMQSSLKAMF